MTIKLIVSLGGRHVGDLSEEEGGRIGFSYGPSWLEGEGAFPISLSLPLRDGPQESPAAHALRPARRRRRNRADRHRGVAVGVSPGVMGAGHPEAADAVAPFLMNPQDEIRNSALSALSNMGSTARTAIPWLEEASLHPDERYRHLVRILLGRLRRAGGG